MCSCSFNSCVLHSLYDSEVCDIHWSWSSFFLHLSWFVTVPDAECKVLQRQITLIEYTWPLSLFVLSNK